MLELNLLKQESQTDSKKTGVPVGVVLYRKMSQELVVQTENGLVFPEGYLASSLLETALSFSESKSLEE